MAATKRRVSRGVRIGAWSTGAVLALVALLYGLGFWYANSHLPQGASVSGVSVGGLANAEARAVLERELKPRLDQPVTVRSGDKSITKTPTELGLGIDFEASLVTAGANPGANPIAIGQALLGGTAHDAVATSQPDPMTTAMDELAQLINNDPVDATLAYDDKLAAVVTPDTPGHAVDAEATARKVRAEFLSGQPIEATVTEVTARVTAEAAQQVKAEVAEPAVAGPIAVTAEGKTVSLTPAMIAKALTFAEADGVLAPQLDAKVLLAEGKTALTALGLKEPKDARFTFASGKPAVVPSESGRGIAADDLHKAVLGVLSQSGERAVTVPVSDQEPALTTEAANAAGVKEITGEFTTYYPASAYRVNNIGKTATLLNGYYVAPGETFSLNKVLGPRTLARGWMAGGAIDGGRVVERMGGGISQTTTTLFNAIFFAGLEDVYHKPHSLYFSRYPMGREATLDYHSVDMKFRNDSKYGVVLQAFTNNPRVGGRGSITVRVWSTKTYTIKATDPVKSRVRAPGKPIQDNSAVCTPQSGMSGFRVDYKRLFYVDGKLVKTQPFTWTYNTLTPVQCTNPNARRDRIER